MADYRPPGAFCLQPGWTKGDGTNPVSVVAVTSPGYTSAYNPLDGFAVTTTGTSYDTYGTPTTYTNGYNYDASGRISSTDMQQCSADSSNNYSSSENMTTYTYDVDDHVLWESGGSSSAPTIEVFDRDSAGEIWDSHTTVASGWNDQYGRLGGNPAPSFGAISEPRPESLTGWGMIAIQGVRGVDAVLTQWTTPDAYAGSVHDPASQKPYMYEGNNSYAYSDPSGYLRAKNWRPVRGLQARRRR